MLALLAPAGLLLTLPAIQDVTVRWAYTCSEIEASADRRQRLVDLLARKAERRADDAAAAVQRVCGAGDRADDHPYDAARRALGAGA